MEWKVQRRSARYSRKLLVLAVLGTLLFLASSAMAQVRFRKCPPFHLRTESGEIINPISGQNADKPYSTRATCGIKGCHDYDAITKGFHFQQGWDEISDTYSEEKPWVLSPGMLGKM